MGWQTVDAIHRERYKRDFVDCEELNERKYIIETIMEQFPCFEYNAIEKAIEYSSQTIKAPQERMTFLRSVACKISELTTPYVKTIKGPQQKV